jgi:hypothetical protein
MGALSLSLGLKEGVPVSRVQGLGSRKRGGRRKTCTIYRDLNLKGNTLLVRIDQILDNIEEN